MPPKEQDPKYVTCEECQLKMQLLEAKAHLWMIQVGASTAFSAITMIVAVIAIVLHI